MTPSSYHHGDLRSALVDAARRLVEREGAGGVSLRAIAREAGVSAAAPYHHFDDREALLAAVAAAGFRSLSRAMEEGAASPAGEGRLSSFRAVGSAYVRFAVENPELFRLMFSGLLSDRTRHAELKEAADATWGVLEGQLGGPSAGEGPGAPPEVGLASWSMVHGLGFLLIEGLLDREAADADVDETIRKVTRVLGRGLGAYLGGSSNSPEARP